MKIREIAKHSPLQEGAIADKVIPGVGFADIGIRAAQDDYPGAAIAGVAAGLGLIPTPITRGASIGLDVVNQLRDLAKEHGGWANLGKELSKAARDSDAGMGTMYESFAELDRLEESGELDEGGVRDVFTKWGPEGYQWLKKALTRKKPDVPTPKPPLSAAEREAAERAEELAARQAEKQPKITDRRGQPKQDEVPIINKDAPSAPKNIEVPPRGKLESNKAYLKRLDDLGPEYRAKYLKDLEDLEKIPKSIPQKIVQKAADVSTYPFRHPIKTVLGTTAATGLAVPVASTLGTGYYYLQDPDAGLGPAMGKTLNKAWELGKGVVTGFSGKSPQELKKDIEKAAEKGWSLSDMPQSTSEPSSDAKPADTAKPDSGAPEAPATEPKNKEPDARTLPLQGKADKEKDLTEKYQQFLNDDKKPQYTKEQFIQLAAKYAKQYDVPLPVVLHAMRKETGAYDANTAATIRGPKTPYGQAVGVMQLMPTFFKTLKPEDLENPDRNIEAGTKFLANLYKTYGSAEAALAAYNAGPYNKRFKAWLKSNDPRDLPAQTREYLYGNPRKKTVGYVDDVAQQVALLNPPTAKDKIVQVATDVLATATGSGDARAANSNATKNVTQVAYPRHGAPIDQQDFDYKNSGLVPIDGRVQKQIQDLSRTFQGALDTALKDYKGTLRVTGGTRTQEDQTRLYNAYIADQKILRDHGGNAAEARKYGYRGLEQASKNLGGHAGYAIDVDPGDLLKFHKWLQKNDPDGKKYGLQTGYSWRDPDTVHLELKNWWDIDEKRRALNATLPKGKKLANAAEYDRYMDQQRLAAQDEVKKAERLIDPGLGGAPEARADSKDSRPSKFPSIRSDIPSADYQSQGDDTPAKSAEKKAEKPGSRKDLEITDKGGEPGAADVERSRNITGRKDPLIDPDTGFPTTEKALRDKLTQRAADEKAAAEREAKRIADLEKAQRDSEAKRKVEKPADKEAGKADAGTGLAGTDTGKDKGKADKQQRVPVAPAAEVPAADAKDKSAKINVRKEFEKAFAAARAAQVLKTGKGSGGTFTWTDPRTGKEGTFTTDYGDEVKDKKSVKVAPKAEPKAEPKADDGADTYWVDPRSAKIPYDVIRKQVKPDYTVDADPDAIKVPRATEPGTDTKLPSQTRSVSEPGRANVLRSTDGTPVTSGTGEPWGTGTSTKDDIKRAKDELQQKIDDEKFKKELEKISPDLSKIAEPEDTFRDKWNRGIDTLTGNRRAPDDRDRIRVPESVNTELNDILWLAGRVKR